MEHTTSQRDGGDVGITSLASMTGSSKPKEVRPGGLTQTRIASKPKMAIIDTHVTHRVPHSALSFNKKERKKAYRSAVYYSECYLKGVKPTEADIAAHDVQGTYKKWWVESNFHHHGNHSKEPQDEEKVVDRTDLSTEGVSLKRSRGSSSTEYSNDRKPRKHKQRRGGVRDVIDAVTAEFQDSDVNSQAGIVTLSDSDHNPVNTISSDDDFSVHTNRLSLDSITPASAFTLCTIPKPSQLSGHQVAALRSELIAEIKASGGDTTRTSFVSKLGLLHSFYRSRKYDARKHSCNFDLDGSWFTLSKPTYFECKGRNNMGNYMYSLGRMAFDMFRPTGLVCSIQGIFNTVHRVPDASLASIAVPRSLRKEIRHNTGLDGSIGLRTYNIVVAFSTEEDTPEAAPTTSRGQRVAPNPIRGIMTNFGYFLPDPEVPNRLSVWFTGGSLEVNDERDLDEWKRIFHHDRVPKRDMKEYARVLATKILLGASAPETMEEDGTMEYRLKRPIGGHGRAFCDVMYLDETLRIMRGHQGSIFVFSRVPPFNNSQEGR